MKAHLDPIDVEALETAAQCRRDWLMIRMLYRLGCRVTELLQIGLDDIDFENSRVAIKHLKSRTLLKCPGCSSRLSRRHVYCPSCGNRVKEAVTKQTERRKERSIPIDADTLGKIHNYVKDGGPVVKDDKTVLFGVNRHRAWQILKECGERVGIPKLCNPDTGRSHYVSPHRIRDAFADKALKTDDSMDSVKKLQMHLGHQSISTTMKYRKINDEEQRQWYSRIWENSNGSTT